MNADLIQRLGLTYYEMAVFPSVFLFLPSNCWEMPDFWGAADEDLECQELCIFVGVTFVCVIFYFVCSEESAHDGS